MTRNRPAAVTIFLLLMTAGLFLPGLIRIADACGMPPVDDDGYWEIGERRDPPAESLAEAREQYRAAVARLLTGARETRLETAGRWGPETGAILHGPAETADALLLWMKTEPEPWIVRVLLDQLTGYLHRSMQPVFHAALDHPDDGVRAAAYEWYGKVRDDRATARLERLWRSTPAWSRGALARALARQGSTRHIEPILEYACNRDRPAGLVDRNRMAEAVMMTDDEAVIPCLIGMVREAPPEFVHWTASSALEALAGRLDHPRVQVLFAALARQANAAMQYQALVHLEDEPFPGAGEVLREVAMDRSQPAAVRLFALDRTGLLDDGHIPLMYRLLEEPKQPRSWEMFHLAGKVLVESGLETKLSIRELSPGEWTESLIMTGPVQPPYRLETGSDEADSLCRMAPMESMKETSELPDRDHALVLVDHFEGGDLHWARVERAGSSNQDACWIRFDALEPMPPAD